MEQIGFLGNYDNKDLLLNMGKVLTNLGKRVLIVDATYIQRLRYIVPNVSDNKNPMTFVSEYQGIDVALGFMNLQGIAQYLRTNELPYDFALIQSDNIQTMGSFGMHQFKKLFFTTSYDQYEVQKSFEIFENINQPISLVEIIITADISSSQAKYLKNRFSRTNIKIEKEIIFPDNNNDRMVTLQNQLLKELVLKHYTNTYKEDLEYIIALMTDGIVNQNEIKRIIKKM